MATLQVFSDTSVVVENGQALHELYPRLLETVLTKGRRVSPRGEPTYEIAPLIFSLENPRDCINLQRARKLNYAYAIVEKLSLVRGVADVGMFCYYIPRLRELLNRQGVFEGAYAPRVAAQLGHIYRLPQRDPDTRRAVITILSATDQHNDVDIPCTVSLQFLLREGRLSLIADMRSSDVFLGLPYDVQQFTFLQQLMAHWLRVDLGTYIHIANSAHIYTRDIAAANELLQAREDLNETHEPPVDLEFEEVRDQITTFFALEEVLRTSPEFTSRDHDRAAHLTPYLRAQLARIEVYVGRVSHLASR